MSRRKADPRQLLLAFARKRRKFKLRTPPRTSGGYLRETLGSFLPPELLPPAPLHCKP